MAKGNSLMAQQRVLDLTKNSKVRKILKRKMKAGVSPARLGTVVKEWQSLSNPDLKKMALKKLNSL